MLKLTFLFSIFNSEIAASILSPPTNLDGLASEEFNAIFDFLIKNSNSQFSGFTVSPLLSVEITFTVITSFTFLPLNHSKGSGPSCFSLFKSYSAAEKCHKSNIEKIKGAGYESWLCRTIKEGVSII